MPSRVDARATRSVERAREESGQGIAGDRAAYSGSVRTAIVLLALAAGCGPGHFVRTDGANADEARDVYACHVESERLAEPPGGTTALGPAIATTINKRRLFRECMAARGWRPE
jgi:hypothetical protein